jgi:hypothetical protein
MNILMNKYITLETDKMKNIKIRKSNYFSNTSKIYVIVGSRKVLINGFGSYTIPVNEGENIYASQLWTGSNRIDYNKLEEGISLLIKPRLSRLFALITGIVFLLCSVFFIFTGFRWSFLPLIPFAIYIGVYLTILRDRYLIIEIDI